jgi:hypothetical protein
MSPTLATAAVEHKVFGIGAVMSYANGIATVKFKKRGADRKFKRQVCIEYLTGETEVFTVPDLPVSAGSTWRSPDKTAAERAWRDFLVGILRHDGALLQRGLCGLLTIGRGACRGLSEPNDNYVHEPVRVSEYGSSVEKRLSRARYAHSSSPAYDRTVDYIVDSLAHPGKNNVRFMWKHIRNRFISDIRKATALKRRRPAIVTYLDAMGTFRESWQEVNRAPNHRCHVCRTAFYAKRRDAKHCSEKCQKRAERRKD